MQLWCAAFFSIVADSVPLRKPPRGIIREENFAGRPYKFPANENTVCNLLSENYRRYFYDSLFLRMAVLFGQLRDLAELAGDVAVAFPAMGQQTAATVLDAVADIPEIAAAPVP